MSSPSAYIFITFQKNLIVWKPVLNQLQYHTTVQVSEELNSVETHFFIIKNYNLSIVSEELNSVETICSPSHETMKSSGFQKNLIVWKLEQFFRFGNNFLFRFRRT